MNMTAMSDVRFAIEALQHLENKRGALRPQNSNLNGKTVKETFATSLPSLLTIAQQQPTPATSPNDNAPQIQFLARSLLDKLFLNILNILETHRLNLHGHRLIEQQIDRQPGQALGISLARIYYQSAASSSGETDDGKHAAAAQTSSSCPSDAILTPPADFLPAAAAAAANSGAGRTASPVGSIYIDSIQRDSVAHKSGRLAVGDKILSVNGRLLAGNITTREAGDCLRQAHGTIYLVIARPVKSSNSKSAAAATRATDFSASSPAAADRRAHRRHHKNRSSGGEDVAVEHHRRHHRRRHDKHRRRDQQTRPHNHAAPAQAEQLPSTSNVVSIIQRATEKILNPESINLSQTPSRESWGIANLITAAGHKPSSTADTDKSQRPIDGRNLILPNAEAPSLLRKQTFISSNNSRRRISDVIIEEETSPLPDPAINDSGEVTTEDNAGGEKEMVLNTEWTEVEIIELENEGRGLGFGIVGGRSTGVVVKTILHQGAAKKDGRLAIGDHIIQINDVHLTGMASEQVATILRQCPHHVRLIVARAHDENTPAVEGYNPQLGGCWVIRTGLLSDSGALEDALVVPEGGKAIGTPITPSTPSRNTPSQQNTPSTTPGRQHRLHGTADGHQRLSIDSGSTGATGGLPTQRRQSSSESHHRKTPPVGGVQQQLSSTSLTVSITSSSPPPAQHLQHKIILSPHASPVKGENLEKPVQKLTSVAEAQEEHSGSHLQQDDEENEADERTCLLADEPTPAPRPVVVSDPVTDKSRRLSAESADFATEFDVVLDKTEATGGGLGITIAGYVGNDELPGIFIKHVAKNSPASQNGLVRINDQIVGVNDQTLDGLTNHQAVELLRFTPNRVRLRLRRYAVGSRVLIQSPVFAPTSEVVKITNSARQKSENRNPAAIDEDESESLITGNIVDSNLGRKSSQSGQSDKKVLNGGGDHATLVAELVRRASDALSIPQQLPEHRRQELEHATTRWKSILSSDYEIYAACITKYRERGGLGVSLEGTVDVNGEGEEVRPHHYLRTIVENGPVGITRQFKSGDELLEANGARLQGADHRQVLKVLRSLPLEFVLVCSRRSSKSGLGSRTASRTPSLVRRAKKQRLQSDPEKEPPANLGTLNHGDQISLSEYWHAKSPPKRSKAASVDYLHRIVKAKSDSSLASPSLSNNSWRRLDAVYYSNNTDQNQRPKRRRMLMKCRSLEPLSGLAIWNPEPTEVRLIKADRGLGFSILDYQDPMSPLDTVIVVRSLVPGGVTDVDGRIAPGDRLLYVNQRMLDGASLEQAVEVLKCAPRGVVRIGVAKPLPLGGPGAGKDDQFGRNFQMKIEELVHPVQLNAESSHINGHRDIHERSVVTEKSATTVTAREPTTMSSATAVTHQSQQSTDDLLTSSNNHQALIDSLSSIGSRYGQTSSSERPMSTADLQPPLPYGVAPTPYNHHHMSSLLERKRLQLSSSASPPPLPPSSSLSTFRSSSSASAALPISSAYHHRSRLQQQQQQQQQHEQEKLLNTTTNVEEDFINNRTSSSSAIINSDYNTSTSTFAMYSSNNFTNSATIDALALPHCLHKSLTLSKGGLALGLQLKPSARTAANGCTIVGIEPDSAAALDGRLRPGDLILAINHESLRKVLSSQARAIVRRASFLFNEIEIDYISRADALAYARRIQKEVSPEFVLAPSPSPTRRPIITNTVTDSLPADIISALASNEDELAQAAAAAAVTKETLVMIEMTTIIPDSSSKSQQQMLAETKSERKASSISASVTSATSSSASTSSSSSSPSSFSRPEVAEKSCGTDDDLFTYTASSDGPAAVSIEAATVAAAQGTSALGAATAHTSSAAASSSAVQSPEDILLRVTAEKLGAAQLEKKKENIADSKQHEKLAANLASFASTEIAVVPPPQQRITQARRASIERHWGKPHTVSVERESSHSLGISIVGGRVEMFNLASSSSSSRNISAAAAAAAAGNIAPLLPEQQQQQQTPSETSISGIFVKSVVPGSAADQCGELKVGDRIMEVNGVDVSTASHERAVQVIKQADSPVVFLIQSLVCDTNITARRRESGNSADGSEGEENCRVSLSLSSSKFDPNLLAPGDELVRATIVRDPTYGGLGISLAGNRDRRILSTFVVDVEPNGPVGRDGVLRVGDELIEVNGIDLRGRSHLNVSAVIKKLDDARLDMVAIRRANDGGTNEMAAVVSSSIKSPFGSGSTPMSSSNTPTTASAVLTPAALFSNDATSDVSAARGAVSAAAQPHSTALTSAELAPPRSADHAASQHATAAEITEKSHQTQTKSAETDESDENQRQLASAAEKKLAETFLAQNLYKNIRIISIDKGSESFGFGVSEGGGGGGGEGDKSHSNVFIRTIAETGPAASASGDELRVDDQILAVNSHDITELPYDQALKRLCGVSGMVTLIVAASDEESRSLLETGAHAITFQETAEPEEIEKHVQKSKPTPDREHPILLPPSTATESESVSLQSVEKVADYEEEHAVETIEEQLESEAALAVLRSPSHSSSSSPQSLAQHSASLKRPSHSTGERASAAAAPLVSFVGGGRVSDVKKYAKQISIEPALENIANMPPGQQISATIDIIRDQSKALGLGITNIPLCEFPVQIKEVYPNSVAARTEKFIPGDHIMEVNSQTMRHVTHETAVHALNTAISPVRLKIYRPNEPLCDDERYFHTLDVDLVKKPNKGFGIIVSPYASQPGIFISSILKDGVVDVDGRLHRGDQILSINDMNTQVVADHMTALSYLKTCTGKVRIRVKRPRLQKDEAGRGGGVERSLAHLLKRPAQELLARAGTTLGGDKQHGGAAAASERSRSVMPPATMMRESERDTSANTQVRSEAAARKADTEIEPDVLHSSSADAGGAGGAGGAQQLPRSSSAPPSRKTHAQQMRDERREAAEQQAAERQILQAQSSSEKDQLPHSDVPPSAAPTSPVMDSKLITLERGASGLGFSIVGGRGTDHGDLPIYIKTIFPGGAAEKNGHLKRGDQILAVNGESLEGATHEQAVEMLKFAKGKLVLSILSNAA